MKQYLVEILWNDPFPKQSPYRTEASSFIPAIAKALRIWRKENKGRKIKKGMIKFQHYGTKTDL
jgi:hypothetical protein